MFFAGIVYAGEAGVGVINVPPKYGYIRVEQQDNLIRVYLTISDYNSWGDIEEVNVTLDNYGTPIATFIFKQYQDKESYLEVNEFSEIPETLHLLQKEKCLYEKSDSSETIDDRCDLEIRFVFQKTLFTGLHILITDRDGLTPAEAYIHYSTEETIRESNILVLPFIGGTISVNIPPYLLNNLALIISTFGTLYYFKKKGYLRKRRSYYEKV